MTAALHAVPTSWPLDAADEALLDRAFTDFKDYNFRQLHRLMWGGEVTEASPSEADLHLLALLCRLTRDPEQVERLWRASAVGRLPGRAAKLARADYGARTITAALRRTEREWRLSQFAVPVASSTDAPAIRTLAEIWADPDARTAPAAVIPRLAWKGRLTVYSALDKAGKSTVTSAGVAALTQGRPFLGEPCAQGTALWAMLEEHVNDLATRAMRFGTDPTRLHVVEHPSDPAAAIRDAVDRLRPSVLVVDTLVRYAGSTVTEGGSSAQWTGVMSGLQSLAREYETAVLVLHHARKSDGQARDSSEITARADVVLEQLQRPEGNVQRIAVRGRWAQPAFAVQLVGDRHELLTATVSGDAQTPSAAQALAALRDGMTHGEWHKASGLPKSTFNAVLKHLTNDVEQDEESKRYRRTPSF